MFQNPTMLAGLAGAMLPLVLHLLTRARYQNMQWGAMMFLAGEDPKQMRQSRIREWLLLGLRMGTIALLAVALARPVLAPSGAAVDGPSATVIVIDRSASMGIEQNGPRRLDSAIRAATGVLSQLKVGDEAALIQIPEPLGGNQGFTTDLQQLGVRISEIGIANARADLAAALNAARAMLDGSRAAFKHLVLISDRQAVSWREVNDLFAAQWNKRPAGGAPFTFTVIPIGAQEVGNVAVESVRVANPPVIRDVPAQIEVRVHNYDTIPSAVIPLTISTDTQELHRTTVSLDAGATATIHCSVRFPDVNSFFVVARLGTPSGLTMDDSMDVAIEVTEPIGVLVISGDERDSSARDFRSEADFLRLALAPFEFDGRAGSNLARVTVATADAWPKLDRTVFQVVALANVPRLVAAQVRQLEQYVYGGGGLLIAPGNLSRVEDYNAHLWRDGAGVMPAELLPATAADGSQATTLLGLDLSHSIFQFLQGRDEPVPRVTVARYFPSRVSESQAHVLGQYASGQPFILESSYGKGRVLLFTSPLDADWSTLPLSNVYLPLMQSGVRYLAAGIFPDRNLWSNEPIIAMIDDPIEPRGTIHAPGNQRSPVDLLQVGDGFEARFANTRRAGQYGLRVETERGVRRIYFSVRAPRDESDVTNLSASRFASIQELLKFNVIESDPQSIAQAMVMARRRTELWLWLVVGVIALATLEIALTCAWSAAPPKEVVA